MTYEEMKGQLVAYNWDDGFDLPQKIISDKNCDLCKIRASLHNPIIQGTAL